MNIYLYFYASASIDLLVNQIACYVETIGCICVNVAVCVVYVLKRVEQPSEGMDYSGDRG